MGGGIHLLQEALGQFLGFLYLPGAALQHPHRLGSQPQGHRLQEQRARLLWNQLESQSLCFQSSDSALSRAWSTAGPFGDCAEFPAAVGALRAPGKSRDWGKDSSLGEQQSCRQHRFPSSLSPVSHRVARLQKTQSGNSELLS